MKSDSMTLNAEDWKAGAKAAVVWAAPVVLLYVNSVIGTIQQEGHVFAFTDMIPSTFTQGGIMAWFLMQVQGMLIRLVNGK